MYNYIYLVQNACEFLFLFQASVSVKRLGVFLQNDELDLESTSRRDEPATGQLKAHVYSFVSYTCIIVCTCI